MFPMPDLGPIMPEILMTCAGLFILILDLAIRKKHAVGLTVMAASAIVGYSVINSYGTTFGGMYVADGYAMFFKMVFLISLFLTVLMSFRFAVSEGMNYGEYYILMLFATLGMMIMASAGDLMVLYLGLELMALSTYVLAGMMKHSKRSNEASIKYFLLGSFASAILLFAIMLVYGQTGTTDIKAIALSFSGGVITPALMLTLIMFSAAFCFKIAAVPFHMWAPDVYEGSPTPITAFMSIGPKAAGFAVLGRVFLISLASFGEHWRHIIIPVAVLTMAAGNIIAISQTNIKRMLAYSSIAHAGYALLGIIAGGEAGISSVMNYMLIYLFMNIGAFSIVVLLGRDREDISSYEGLSKTHPAYALAMLIFMFSLAGIPPTAGFVGKLYLFIAAVNAGYTWLVAVSVVFSAISAYFYLRIVLYMYMREPKAGHDLMSSNSLKLAIAITALAVLVLGMMPDSVLSLAIDAASNSQSPIFALR